MLKTILDISDNEVELLAISKIAAPRVVKKASWCK